MKPTDNRTRREINAEAVANVRQHLKEAGFNIETPKDAAPGLREPRHIHIKTPGGHKLLLDPMVRAGFGHYTSSDERSLLGWTVRYGYGRGSMGTQRYPLKKNGTIDVVRLGRDIESYDAILARKSAAEDTVAFNVKQLKPAFDNVKSIATKLNGAAGAGVFIDVDNDGASEGRIRFKVSGHISPARAAAILAAVDATREL